MEKKVTYRDLFDIPETVLRDAMESGLDIRRLYGDIIKCTKEDVLLYDLTGKSDSTWDDVRPDQVERFIKTMIEEIVDHFENLQADDVEEEDMYYIIDQDRAIGFQPFSFYLVDYQLEGVR